MFTMDLKGLKRGLEERGLDTGLPALLMELNIQAKIVRSHAKE